MLIRPRKGENMTIMQVTRDLEIILQGLKQGGTPKDWCYLLEVLVKTRYKLKNYSPQTTSKIQKKAFLLKLLAEIEEQVARSILK